MPRPRRPRSPPTSASLAVACPLLLLLLLPLDAGATCDASALYDPTYATSAAGRGAADVRAWLHERSSAFHAPRTYSQAWTDLESIDQHNASHVDVIYGGVEPKCRAGAYYGLACQDLKLRRRDPFGLVRKSLYVYQVLHYRAVHGAERVTAVSAEQLKRYLDSDEAALSPALAPRTRVERSRRPAR